MQDSSFQAPKALASRRWQEILEKKDISLSLPFNKIKANCSMVEFLASNYEEYLLKFDIMFTTIMMHYFIKDATSCSYIEETY